MAALDDFDDGAMDFGDADEAEAKTETQGGACASVASLAAALSGLMMGMEAVAAPAPTPAPTAIPTVARPPPPPLAELVEAGAHEELVCPLTLQLLDDLVMLVGDGMTYSRAAIEMHLAWCRDRKC